MLGYKVSWKEEPDSVADIFVSTDISYNEGQWVVSTGENTASLRGELKPRNINVGGEDLSLFSLLDWSQGDFSSVCIRLRLMKDSKASFRTKCQHF